MYAVRNVKRIKGGSKKNYLNFLREIFAYMQGFCTTNVYPANFMRSKLQGIFYKYNFKTVAIFDAKKYLPHFETFGSLLNHFKLFLTYIYISESVQNLFSVLR